jgi:trk system potassium uptake protein TrkH
VLGTTFALLAIGAVAFLVIEWNGAFKDLSALDKAIAAFFQSTTPRTAGFDTVPQSLLSMPSVLLILLLMFIGASPGSTGGGVKTTTFFVVFEASLRGVDPTNGSLVFKGRSVDSRMIAKAIGVIGKALVIIVFAIMIIFAIEADALSTGRMEFVEVVFEVLSAFATVGLSLGITSSLAAASKLVLILTMFIGRIGLFTFAIPLPSKHIERFVDFPKAEMMIG